MLSSRFAGIPISSSIIDGRGVPQLRNRGEQTLRPSQAQVAGFKSEWWPESNRNGGRLQIGIPGRIASEFAYQIHLSQEKRLSASSILVAVAAIRFLYKVTLRRGWSVDEIIPTCRKPQKLPARTRSPGSSTPSTAGSIAPS